MQTILLYIYITKYSFFTLCLENKTTGKRVEGMAVNQENSTEWDFTKARNPALGKHAPIADSLTYKDNLVKKRTLIRLGCVDAHMHARTHST